MKSKGISVRPIALLDGEHEINEVWFDDVEVPVAQPRRRGEQGLDVREVPAGHERAASRGVGESKRELRSLKDIARARAQ